MSRTLLACVLGMVGWALPALADEDRRRGMITLSYAYASDSEGPSTRGPRIGYGYVGGPRNDYPWAELWATFREDGESDVAAAGLSAVPVSKLSRRYGVGPLVDLGVSRRRERGDTDWTVIIGGGVEGVVRTSRHWDLVTTGEAVYRVPNEIELQVRIGIRFHHEKLPPLGGGS